MFLNSFSVQKKKIQFPMRMNVMLRKQIIVHICFSFKFSERNEQDEINLSCFYFSGCKFCHFLEAKCQLTFSEIHVHVLVFHRSNILIFTIFSIQVNNLCQVLISNLCGRILFLQKKQYISAMTQYPSTKLVVKSQVNPVSNLPKITITNN